MRHQRTERQKVFSRIFFVHDAMARESSADRDDFFNIDVWLKAERAFRPAARD